MNDNVIPLRARRNDLQEAVDTIKDIIYGYAGTMSLAEAIGIIEMAKLEILEDQKGE